MPGNESDVVLKTPRLILRRPIPSDFDAFCDMMANEKSAEHIGGVMTRTEAWRIWCMVTGAWDVRGFSMFSVLLKTDQGTEGPWIGRVGPWQPEGWPGTEVGWAVAQKYEGQGYALEASAACMDYAFDVLGWDDVMHIINPRNHPSMALARRLGSTNRGQTWMPEPYHEIEVYNWGQSREQWQRNRQEVAIRNET